MSIARAGSILETSLDKVKERIQWVKESAKKHGRDPELIEFQMLFPNCKITDAPESMLEGIAKEYGISLDAVRAQPQWLIGSSDEVIDKLVMIRKETGINYMVFAPFEMESIDTFANDVLSQLS